MDGTQLRLYLKGVEDGLRAYAWWKDGVQYVGTCGTTLDEAIERSRQEMIDGRALERFGKRHLQRVEEG